MARRILRELRIDELSLYHQSTWRLVFQKGFKWEMDVVSWKGKKLCPLKKHHLLIPFIHKFRHQKGLSKEDPFCVYILHDEDSEQNKNHQRKKILIFVWYFRVLFDLIALFCFASVVHWLACRPGTKEKLDSPSSQVREVDAIVLAKYGKTNFNRIAQWRTKPLPSIIKLMKIENKTKITKERGSWFLFGIFVFYFIWLPCFASLQLCTGWLADQGPRRR